MPSIISEAEVRGEALPPTSGGVSPSALSRYINEAEGRIRVALGSLPDNEVIRGVVRDVAASRALMKLANTLEDYREARELLGAATDTLKDYIEQGGEGVGGYAEGVNENAVANIDEQPLWDAREFDVNHNLVLKGADPTDDWAVWG